MTNEISQNMYAAFDRYLIQISADLPDESELAALHSFSDRFERKMRRLVHRAARLEKTFSARAKQAASNGHANWRLRKQLVFAAIVLSILVSVMSITAAREAIYHFFVQIYEKYSAIIFDRSPAGTTAGSIQPSEAADADRMKPSWLPAGYSQANLLVSNQMIQIIYTDPVNTELILERHPADQLQVLLDTEGTDLTEISFGGRQGMISANRGLLSLVWQEGAYVYLISGKITKEEALQMADSTNR